MPQRDKSASAMKHKAAHIEKKAMSKKTAKARKKTEPPTAVGREAAAIRQRKALRGRPIKH